MVINVNSLSLQGYCELSFCLVTYICINTTFYLCNYVGNPTDLLDEDLNYYNSNFTFLLSGITLILDSGAGCPASILTRNNLSKRFPKEPWPW